MKIINDSVSTAILIVDDDKMVAEIEKIMLEGLGYKAIFITNSLEALEKLCYYSHGFDYY